MTARMVLVGVIVALLVAAALIAALPYIVRAASRPDESAGVPANGSAGKPGPRHARPRRKFDSDLAVIFFVGALLLAGCVWELRGAPVPDWAIGPARAKTTTTAKATTTLTPVPAPAAQAAGGPAQATTPQGTTSPHAQPHPHRAAAPRVRVMRKTAPRWTPSPAQSTSAPVPTAPEPSGAAPAPTSPAIEGIDTPPSSPLDRLLDLLRGRRQ